VIQGQVCARPRDHPSTLLGMTLSLSKGQDREALQEVDGVEHEVRRAVRPRAPEARDDLPLRGEAEPVLRHRRSQGVPTEPLETLPRVGGDVHARMEIESLLAGVMARGGRDLVLDRLGAALQIDRALGVRPVDERSWRARQVSPTSGDRIGWLSAGRDR
jgi:hypothetical protein